MTQSDSCEVNLMQEDALVLKELERQGADLSQPRGVAHYLYFQDEAAARNGARSLEVKGFGTKVEFNAGVHLWQVSAHHVYRVAADTIAPLVRDLTQLAISLHADYDGWEAEVRP